MTNEQKVELRQLMQAMVDASLVERPEAEKTAILNDLTPKVLEICPSMLELFVSLGWKDNKFDTAVNFGPLNQYIQKMEKIESKLEHQVWLLQFCRAVIPQGVVGLTGRSTEKPFTNRRTAGC